MHRLLRLLLQISLAAAVAGFSIHYSYLHQRLMWRPIGDDAYYFSDAIWRLRAFKFDSTLDGLKTFFVNPPHSPFSTLLAMLSFTILGWYDWAPYAGNALIVLALLLTVDWITGPLKIFPRLCIYALVLSTRLPKIAIEEFRPDFAAALVTVVGVIFILRKSLSQSTRRRQFLAGARFALAILFKPSTFPLTLGVFGATLFAFTILELRRQSLREILLSIFRTLAGYLILSSPYFLLAGKSIAQYFFSNTFGSHEDVWAVKLPLIDSLRYYYDGPGGDLAIGRAQIYLFSLIALAGFIFVWRSNDREKFHRAIALAFVALIAYAGPTIVSVKNPFFGSVSEILLLMAAIFTLKEFVVRWQYEMRNPNRAAIFLIPIILSLIFFELPKARINYSGRNDPRVIASNRLTADIYQTIKSRAVAARIFIPAYGQTVEPACLNYLASLDGLPLNFTALDFAKPNDIDLIDTEIAQSDYIIAGDPGNDEARQNLASVQFLDLYIARITAHPDFQEIANFPTANGKNYHVYKKSSQ